MPLWIGVIEAVTIPCCAEAASRYTLTYQVANAWTRQQERVRKLARCALLRTRDASRVVVSLHTYENVPLVLLRIGLCDLRHDIRHNGLAVGEDRGVEPDALRQEGRSPIPAEVALGLSNEVTPWQAVLRLRRAVRDPVRRLLSHVASIRLCANAGRISAMQVARSAERRCAPAYRRSGRRP